MITWPLPLPTGAVDALAYAGNWPHWPVPRSDEAALLERMDRLGMQAVVLLSLTTVYGDAMAGNNELAGLVRRHPGRLAGCIVYDPRRTLSPEEVMVRGRGQACAAWPSFPCTMATPWVMIPESETP